MKRESTQADEGITLNIPGDARYLCMVRQVVERFAMDSGFSDEDSKKITLAVDEACSNIIKHTYGGEQEGRINLCLRKRGDGIVISIRDFGKPLDPRSVRPRPLDQIRPGGLGTHFIRAIMDEVKYQRMPKFGTLLTLVKYLNSPAKK